MILTHCLYIFLLGCNPSSAINELSFKAFLDISVTLKNVILFFLHSSRITLLNALISLVIIDLFLSFANGVTPQSGIETTITLSFLSLAYIIDLFKSKMKSCLNLSILLPLY